MKIVHVVFEAPHAHSSGAALRNRAIGVSLAGLGRLSTIIVQERLPGSKQHPKRRWSYVEARLPDALTAQLADEIGRLDPDLVVVDGIFLADIAHRLLDAGRRVVVDMHNVESALLRETNLARRGWRARLFYGPRWRRAERAEARIAGTSAGLWVCSERDEHLLRGLVGSGAPMAVVPNPVPDWCTGAPPVAGSGPPVALFVGHLAYRPNLHAAERLIARIQPQMRAAFPDARMLICGRAPGARLRALADATYGVELIGDPAELAPIYARASVALVPLTEGGGTRLKILEALAVGLPVVATAKAVEGLELAPGRTYLAAETDAQFVAAVRRLEDEPELRPRLAGAGREVVERLHSQAALDRAVARALNLRAS